MTSPDTSDQKRGPLKGIRIVEFVGIGPAPFCGMLLADMGAEVLRIGRPGDVVHPADATCRGKTTINLDLKQPDDKATCLSIIDKADVLIEGFRPGVMEKLGLGPDVIERRNPRLVYGRMTGWGQDGPLALAAGHDINYIAITGALAAIGPLDGPPVPPLNMVGDFGGGALYLALGVVSALFERGASGKGQVIDAAIVDGTASMMTFIQSCEAMGAMTHGRGTALLNGGAPFYGCYACADGRYVSIGAIEPQFFSELVEKLGIDPAASPGRDNPAVWPGGHAAFADKFITRDQQYWCELLEGSDACFAPVLDLDDVADHPHMKARNVYFEQNGNMQANPAPRFSRTPGQAGAISSEPDIKQDILEKWGG